MKPPQNQSRADATPQRGMPIEDHGVRRQLSQLFGESLFGPWPELHQHSARPQPRRNYGSWALRFFVLACIVAAVVGVRALVRPGFQRQVVDQRGHYAQELKLFIDDGNLERAAQYLPLVQGTTNGTTASKALDPNDANLELLVTTEAALYRYYDASPERLGKIRRFLDDTGHASPSRQIASLIVASREERAARISTIERLRNDLPNEYELEYLLATALEFQNDPSLSRSAWERSAKVQPAWLGHRFEQAWFEARHSENTKVQEIASQLVATDPDSNWAKLTLDWFELPADAQARVLHGDAGATAPSPVQSHFMLLTRSVQAAHFNRLGEAKELLRQAAAVVQYQAPFLFDVFDWCVAEQLFALAQDLTRMTEWPNDMQIARAKQRRLADAFQNLHNPTHDVTHRRPAK